MDRRLADAGRAGIQEEVLDAAFDLTAAVVKSRVWRLRKRWVELVREEVANTVQNPDEVDEEIRHLARFL